MPSHALIASRATAEFLAGRYCGEVVIEHVGRAAVPDFDPRLCRIGTGFTGGIGNCGDLCGTVAGAIVVIGLLTGRVSGGESPQRCIRLAAEYRRRFVASLGSVACEDLRAGCGRLRGHARCARVVARGVVLLLELLQEEELYRP